MSLEDELNEAVAEYQKKIKENPTLGKGFSETDTHTPLKGKNIFEVHVYLIQEMRKAYESEDWEMLARIPHYCGNYCGNNPGSNAVTFRSMHDGNDPFDNETSGHNVYWITNTFEQLDASGEQTRFYKYLTTKIKEYKQERDALRDEILASSAFSAAVAGRPHPSQDNRDNRREILRPIYRDEEFKRRDRVIELCNKVEHIYELASRLFEELRPKST